MNTSLSVDLSIRSGASWAPHHCGMLLAVALAACAVVPACSGSRGSASGDDDDDGAPPDREANVPTFSCCLNGQGYACPDEQTMDRCATGDFDLPGCLDACGPDDMDCPNGCFDRLDSATPDPSDCTPDQRACNADRSDDCSSEHEACETSGDCCGALTCGDNGYCAPLGDCVGEFGQCDSDLDCCSGFTCQGLGTCRATGCESDLDCASGNCVDGECQGNDAGDRCDSDFDCAGFGSECIDGVCWSS